MPILDSNDLTFSNEQLINQNLQGTFSIGSRATIIINGEEQTVFIKRPLKSGKNKAKSLTSLKREINILQTFNHKHIVNIIAANTEVGQELMVLEYAENGDLMYWNYHSNNRNFSLHFKLDIIIKVLEAVQYMHAKDIIHCDLKSENILLDINHNPKISDFGHCLQLTSNNNVVITNSIKGSFGHVAPESVTRREYSRETDCFAIGGIICKVLQGFMPIEHLENTEGIEPTLDNINDLMQRTRYDISPRIPVKIRKLIQDVWDPEPTNRPIPTHMIEILGFFKATQNNPSKTSSPTDSDHQQKSP